MNIRRLIARSISEVSAGLSYNSAPSAGLRVLMYHSVGTKAYGDSLGLFSVTEDQFHKQMTLLSNWNQGQIVNFSESSLRLPGTSIAITFDDGYQDNLDVAAPILIGLGMPFTVFVSSELVKNFNHGFLTPASLRSLAGLPGVKIGAHGATHIELSQCDDKILNQELLSSRLYLEDLLGSSVDLLSYPYGAVDRRVRDAAIAAGYSVGACSMAGINQPSRDPMLLSRTEIVAMDDDRVFMQKLHGAWDWYRWRTQDPSCL
jgi:peptidoglycan/xylan/chitin deacetylase (PgdA/CDA1 family)